MLRLELVRTDVFIKVSSREDEQKRCENYLITRVCGGELMRHFRAKDMHLVARTLNAIYTNANKKSMHKLLTEDCPYQLPSRKWKRDQFIAAIWMIHAPGFP